MGGDSLSYTWCSSHTCSLTFVFEPSSKVFGYSAHPLEPGGASIVSVAMAVPMCVCVCDCWGGHSYIV